MPAKLISGFVPQVNNLRDYKYQEPRQPDSCFPVLFTPPRQHEVCWKSIGPLPGMRGRCSHSHIPSEAPAPTKRYGFNKGEPLAWKNNSAS